MKIDAEEFAFFNQQLASMIRHGLPLEPSMRELANSMSRGELRVEIVALSADLSDGVPLEQALDRRKLPPLYVHLLKVGARSDMPKVLLFVADYYRRVHSLWTRLSGLAVYPLIVVAVAFVVSLILASVLHFVTRMMLSAVEISPTAMRWITSFQVILPPLLTGMLLIAFLYCWRSQSVRERLRWRLPAFKEMSVAQVAASMSTLLRGGTPLDEAMEMVASREGANRAGADLRAWAGRVRQGSGKLHEVVSLEEGSLPPMFRWILRNGDDPVTAFDTAAEIYLSRARERTEMLLYGFLPLSVLALGVMIFLQMYTVVAVFIAIVRAFTAYN